MEDDFEEQPYKRLARKSEKPKQTMVEDEHSSGKLSIVEYTPKSFIVVGNTMEHADNLMQLKGKYTDLMIGKRWLFSSFRRQSVEKYIETGEVKPAVYDQQQNQSQPTNSPIVAVPSNKATLRKLFTEFKNAFNKDDDYDGESIIQVIEQLERKYLSDKKEVDKKEFVMEDE